MSKKKSLGSSPIGYKTKSNSMGFIPDLGVSKKSGKEAAKQSKTNITKFKKPPKNKSKKSRQTNKTTKKVVSYNLEIDLIEKVKSIASQKGMYYSSLVSAALRKWIAENN